MKIRINYEASYNNNFKRNVGGAVKWYMNDKGLEQFVKLDNVSKDDIGYLQGLILYPQALNPFLKIMETLDEIKNIVIVPAFNNNDVENSNQPAYLILKFPLENRMVDSIDIEKL